MKTVIAKDANGFTYEEITNDPTGLRLYTLDNGLKVYLSKNFEEPKIQTLIAVRAGSNYDPKQSTGLAHYLEHMLFKGTDSIGTLDWQKEKVYLEKISDLYEKHRAEKNPEKKKEIYKKIDSVSFEASKYCIANEYDKMVSSLGATGTNAHTWFEETVYKNKIPANELDKWLKLEAQRFSKLVLRLFHTELETVFEEFNMGQDTDFRKVYAQMLEDLFPNHPYGQQTTIGEGEHLKNPSMVDIHNYFNKYYVPNNMAMILVGDLEFESTIQKVNNTFGKLKSAPLTHPNLPKESPIEKPIINEVFGPTSENISIAFRTKGINSNEMKMVKLCDMILANGNAGLIDLNLNQKQTVQKAGCSPMFLNDYGFHRFYGTPKKGQSLDDVKKLIFDQINKLKKGEFEDWMINAVINDLKLNEIKGYENNTSLANSYMKSFIQQRNWKDNISLLDDLKNITKEELITFANEFYKDNYVITYKRTGDDKDVVKVENPGITPVNINRDKNSIYLTEFQKITSDPLQPKFVEYEEAIKETNLSNGIEISYINNELNDLFDLNIIFDMGKDHNKKLSLATGYIQYLGTSTYTPEQLKKEFYKLGINYSFSAKEDKTYVSLKGLKENLPEGLKLLEHLWMNAVADQTAYDKYVDKIVKSREDAKTQKSNILWKGLMNYGLYGEDSRFRNILQIDELKAINPEELVSIFKDLKNYKQRIFYYGKDINSVVNSLNENYIVNSTLKDYPEQKTYLKKQTGGKVYFANYDMVQVELLFLAKGKTFDAKKLAVSELFNAYFGSGLSSIVFQEIRERQSLAYSAFSGYSNARKKDDNDIIYAYIGTQSNKINEAITAMMKLMNDMPEAEEQFKAAKESTLKKIAAERIIKSNIFWNYEQLKKRDINYDIRKDIYAEIEQMTIADLKDFFNDNIKNQNYTVVVIGDKEDVDIKTLNKLGEVKEVDIDYLFNYNK